ATFKGSQRYPSGAIRTWTQTYPHHTAVVLSVSPAGRSITVLHQNVSGNGTPENKRRTVQETVIRPAELQLGGSLKAYRPVAESSSRLIIDPDRRSPRKVAVGLLDADVVIVDAGLQFAIVVVVAELHPTAVRLGGEDVSVVSNHMQIFNV